MHNHIQYINISYHTCIKIRKQTSTSLYLTIYQHISAHVNTYQRHLSTYQHVSIYLNMKQLYSTNTYNTNLCVYIYIYVYTGFPNMEYPQIYRVQY